MWHETLRVVARFTARSDTVDELRRLLTGLVQPTRSEPGCISYEMLESTEDPTKFSSLEEWRNEDALQLHFGTSYHQDAVGRFSKLLAEDPDLKRYRLVG
jgi:quinol monooxygenase YgiN